MKKILFTAVLAVISFLAFAQERIAIFPFEDRNNVYTRDELDIYYREFSGEFKNKTDEKKFTVISRQDIEKIIDMEEKFQISDYSSEKKTSEMKRVLNPQQVLHILIIKIDNNIRINVSRYSFPEMEILRGGTSITLTNKSQISSKIPEMVQSMQNAIAGLNANTPTSEKTTPQQTKIPPNFVRIEGGTFIMGSPSNEPEREINELQHTVTVSGFYMGKYQVTQAEYEAVMGTNPSGFKGANLPVEQVSWYDAVEYCNKLSQKEGLTPAYTIDKSRSDSNNKNPDDNLRWLVTWNQTANGYRLPTEAEWEYACRAGTTTPFNTGNNITTSNANYDGNYPYNKNSKGTYRAKTTPVGSFAPNPWGLYDMHGNGWEWCWDWYGNYSSGSQTDPKGAVTGSDRVGRGGGYNSDGKNLRSAYRSNSYPYIRSIFIGFRLVRS
ncbi:MAG: formylglycine-generating enzyme family protein [Treponema sp.]|jgi:formylglycine-generating enzyme required for sulfatase activity|nr:formylglycine-generating enzyme family protein [Treponema sp.]